MDPMDRDATSSGAAGDSFRRRKRADAAPEPEAEPVVLSGEESAGRSGGDAARMLMEIRRGVVEPEVARTLAGPLRDLASAFKLQAELLRSVHEHQVRIETALRDDRRSELVLNSTKVLNETFRDLRDVQQNLVRRLESREARRPAPVLRRPVTWILLLLAGGAVFLVAGPLRGRLFGTGDDRAADVENRVAGLVTDLSGRLSGLETEARRETEAARDAARRTEAAAVAEREERARAEIRLREAETRRAAVESERDVLAARLAAAEAARGELSRELEEKSAGLRAEYERARALALSLAEAEAEARQAAARAGSRDPGERPVSATGPEAVEPAAETARSPESHPAPETAPAVPPAVLSPYGPAPSLERIVVEVNDLLARQRTSNRYVLNRAGGIGADCLTDVNLVVFGTDGRPTKTITAARCRFVLPPVGELLEIEFEEGEILFHITGAAGGGKKSPFYDNRYRLPILGASSAEWIRHGWVFVKSTS